jgi:hypothetical protein
MLAASVKYILNWNAWPFIYTRTLYVQPAPTLMFLYIYIREGDDWGKSASAAEHNKESAFSRHLLPHDKQSWWETYFFNFLIKLRKGYKGSKYWKIEGSLTKDPKTKVIVQKNKSIVKNKPQKKKKKKKKKKHPSSPNDHTTNGKKTSQCRERRWSFSTKRERGWYMWENFS